MRDLLFDVRALGLKAKGFVSPHLLFIRTRRVEHFVSDFVELFGDAINSFLLTANHFGIVWLRGSGFLVGLETKLIDKFRCLEKFFEFAQYMLLDFRGRNPADTTIAFC
ncbi:MAG TPA: hypothetical protein PLZ57_13390 [Pseudobdellovibrionaceae bacterium]|nr:hypothetical protein [Pseudobdellovibrionaceae bacterium]